MGPRGAQAHRPARLVVIPDPDTCDRHGVNVADTARGALAPAGDRRPGDVARSRVDGFHLAGLAGADIVVGLTAARAAVAKRTR